MLLGVALFSVVVVSCEKNDDPGDPVGTVMINMMNEDNGKTILGNSDIYIDSANNFYSSWCLMTNLGKRSGLGGLPAPSLDNLSDRMAVEEGCAYQVFKAQAIREFPSGILAIDISADYYNVYVPSFIKKGDDVAGAVVKYVLMNNIPVNGLPEYETNIGKLSLTKNNSSEITITLPYDDFEYETAFASSAYYTIECQKSGKTLTLKLLDIESPDVFGLYIRIKSSYTYVWGEVVF
jgi:hypothetical protein